MAQGRESSPVIDHCSNHSATTPTGCDDDNDDDDGGDDEIHLKTSNIPKCSDKFSVKKQPISLV